MNPLTWSAFGIPVITSDYLTDGQVAAGFDPASRGGDTGMILVVGTRPLTDIELAGREGRHIVRRGLADVLAWLGQDVGPEPARTGRGLALLAQLRVEAAEADG